MLNNSTPVLSLILCSRNDEYMGHSRWRLETALNHVGDHVRALGRERDVEVLVTDWGSEVPLRDVVALGPAAASIVSFVEVPRALAQELQQDSPFPEVLALNAAARRARGRYIGRIDQDTLVGERFLRQFLAWVEGEAPVDVPLDAALLFANRRSIPYRFSVCCPGLPAVKRFIRSFGDRLHVETGRVFYTADVGIWLLHRDLWNECSGYDERMLYMNDMEIDMATRLMSKYPMIDLGKLVGYDFYHLDHYHPRGSRSSSTHRRVNEERPRQPAGLRPNGDGWGLAAHPLAVSRQAVVSGFPSEDLRAGSRTRPAIVDAAIFAILVLYTRVRMALDHLIYPFVPIWRRRTAIAWRTVRGESVIRWPMLLRRIWMERPSTRAR
jgi:hypothetical protein